MIILRQKIYGLTDDGGGTSSMGFYEKMKTQYEQSGGKDYLGMSFKDFVSKNKAADNGISNQASNLDLDRSSYKASSLKAVGTNGGGGVLGKTSGGLFTHKDPNNVKHTGAYTGVAAGQQHASNANRIWADKNKADNLKKQQQAQAIGFKQGQKSVGLLGGAKNTWDNMSKGQQIATGAIAGTALVGATALALRNRRKRKEAEEELELERARNRR